MLARKNPWKGEILIHHLAKHHVMGQTYLPEVPTKKPLGKSIVMHVGVQQAGAIPQVKKTLGKNSHWARAIAHA